VTTNRNVPLRGIADSTRRESDGIRSSVPRWGE
jgi:hypothetical protein